MLIDNGKQTLKAHEYIAKYTEEGSFDFVTGYFTIGALAALSQEINHKIDQFRFILGDIVNIGDIADRPINLLNENITLEAAFELSKIAQEAVAFLRQDKVLAKTLEPNFCHAKCYLFKAKNDERHHYFLTGSSNLTEAGMGMKATSNIELNIAETSDSTQYQQLIAWFESIWQRPEAHFDKTVIDADGKKTTKPFKQYLIDEIEKIFIKYSPREIYFKMLFELFGNQVMEDESNPDFVRQVGRLENTLVYNALYSFQQKGVLSLIKMLQKYNGAILADAVGLGKTWTALAVMKFYEYQGRQVLLLCPKKLEQNWRRYRRHQDSLFERDNFDYFLRFHTDLSADRLNTYKDTADKLFISDKPKLIVIDESHNLRNDKSQRYDFLLQEIVKKNADIKILMLSATPINNSLNDIRNQFKLIVKGDSNGFEENLGVKNLEFTFRAAQKAFNEWRQGSNPKINEFIKSLPANFFTLTDALTVARTRKMIVDQQTDLTFPKKEKPVNLFVTPTQIGNFESFAELFDHLPKKLPAYMPSYYLETGPKSKHRDVLRDEAQREHALVKMMYMLIIKRLESSWYSFMLTIEKILDYHQETLTKVNGYQKTKKSANLERLKQPELFVDDEFEDDALEMALGKSRPVSIAEIDAAGNLERFKSDLKTDIEAMDQLVTNLKRFEATLKKELDKPDNFKSKDDKLEKLIEQIRNKQKSGKNGGNQKVVIFSAYRDTVKYLFDQLKARGFKRLAYVSGDGGADDISPHESKQFEPLLERFAPFTKLFNEKSWSFDKKPFGDNWKKAYSEWLSWVKTEHPLTHEKVMQPVDILIATDALSEGQNLQDADMVVNYDIHWNPVRVVQRMGRIDRIGSPNETIFGVNFWPSRDINDYLQLQGRIEHKMAAMKLAGAEVEHAFTESFKEMSRDEEFEFRMKERMLQQMESSWDEIEAHEQSLGFDDLSLEGFRQALREELEKNRHFYSNMPLSVYSGLKRDKDSGVPAGLVALLGYPARPAGVKHHEYKVYNLLYLDAAGKPLLANQKEVLAFLSANRDKVRFVADAIDRGEAGAIQQLSATVQAWLKGQLVTEEVQDDGSVKSVAGQAVVQQIQNLQRGNRQAIKAATSKDSISTRLQPENQDLIAWMVVS